MRPVVKDDGIDVFLTTVYNDATIRAMNMFIRLAAEFLLLGVSLWLFVAMDQEWFNE